MSAEDNYGLVAGMIPAGKPCPFLDKCKFKVHTCPGVDGKVKSNHFSCAAARLHAAIAEAEFAPNFQNMARDLVEREPALFEIKKKPARLSFSGLRIPRQEKE